ncbi:MAG: Na+/H+ antiporter subunit E [Alphaproteobacteria bacterium]|nr:Na+/H+ antiporter subunit E [Alphaproteobacteria bacterium]MDX5370028.1 Na+/H+ antiporter subunit E [Alphaproteobacteria bacterium]MDX5464606.1 Na+/H+ antiporter subunit E [Alphaproteobacteria bacterium]
MLHSVTLGLGLAVLWLALSGYYDKPLLLGLGAFSVLLVTWIARRMDMTDGEAVPLQMRSAIFSYWPWLGKEITKSAIGVCKLALGPKSALSPTLVRVKATQKTDVGRVTYANSITLTPGTVTVDIDEDTFLVHGLTRAMAADVESGEMDRRITGTEGR